MDAVQDLRHVLLERALDPHLDAAAAAIFVAALRHQRDLRAVADGDVGEGILLRALVQCLLDGHLGHVQRFVALLAGRRLVEVGCRCIATAATQRRQHQRDLVAHGLQARHLGHGGKLGHLRLPHLDLSLPLRDRDLSIFCEIAQRRCSHLCRRCVSRQVARHARLHLRWSGGCPGGRHARHAPLHGLPCRTLSRLAHYIIPRRAREPFAFLATSPQCMPDRGRGKQHAGAKVGASSPENVRRGNRDSLPREQCSATLAEHRVTV